MNVRKGVHSSGSPTSLAHAHGPSNIKMRSIDTTATGDQLYRETDEVSDIRSPLKMELTRSGTMLTDEDSSINPYKKRIGIPVDHLG